MADRYYPIAGSTFRTGTFDKFRAEDAVIYARIKAEDEVVSYYVLRQGHPQA